MSTASSFWWVSVCLGLQSLLRIFGCSGLTAFQLLLAFSVGVVYRAFGCSGFEIVQIFCFVRTMSPNCSRFHVVQGCGF